MFLCFSIKSFILGFGKAEIRPERESSPDSIDAKDFYNISKSDSCEIIMRGRRQG
jgi:hypothetical protein